MRIAAIDMALHDGLVVPFLYDARDLSEATRPGYAMIWIDEYSVEVYKIEVSEGWLWNSIMAMHLFDVIAECIPQ